MPVAVAHEACPVYDAVQYGIVYAISKCCFLPSVYMCDAKANPLSHELSLHSESQEDVRGNCMDRHHCSDAQHCDLLFQTNLEKKRIPSVHMLLDIHKAPMLSGVLNCSVIKPKKSRMSSTALCYFSLGHSTQHLNVQAQMSLQCQAHLSLCRPGKGQDAF